MPPSPPPLFILLFPRLVFFSSSLFVSSLLLLTTGRVEDHPCRARAGDGEGQRPERLRRSLHHRRRRVHPRTCERDLGASRRYVRTHVTLLCCLRMSHCLSLCTCAAIALKLFVVLSFDWYYDNMGELAQSTLTTFHARVVSRARAARSLLPMPPLLIAGIGVSP